MHGHTLLKQHVHVVLRGDEVERDIASGVHAHRGGATKLDTTGSHASWLDAESLKTRPAGG